MANKEKLLATAQKYLQKGQVARAIKEYEKIVEAEPRDVRSRQKLAELYSRDRRVEPALEAYEAVARHYTDNGFTLKAIAVFKQMQKVDPRRVKTYHRLAELNEKQGLIGNALAEYRSLVAYYEKNGLLVEAVEILQKMRDLEPNNLSIQVKIAETCLASGAPEQAREVVQEALEQLWEARDLARLVKIYQLFLPNFPGELGFQTGLAEALIESGKIEEGLELLQPLVEAEAGHPGVLQTLALGYRRRGDSDGERRVFEQLLEAAPDDPAVREGYLRACFAGADWEQAVTALEEWKDAFFAAGQLELLKAFYAELRERLPTDRRVRDALQRVYEATGEGERLFALMESAEGDAPAAGDDAGAVEPEPATLDQVGAEIEPCEEPATAKDSLDAPAGDPAEPSVDETAADEEVEEPPAEAEMPLGYLEDAEQDQQDSAAEGGDDTPEELPTGAPETELEEVELELDLGDDLFAAPAAENEEVALAGSAGQAPIAAADEAEGRLTLADEDDFGGASEFAAESEPEPSELSLDELDLGAWEESVTPPAAGGREESWSDFADELRGDAEDAVAAVKQSEGSPFRLGGVFSEVTGEVEAAVDPEDCESHYNLGIAYKEMGLFDDAIAEFDRALRHPARMIAALTLKGLCLAAKGEVKEAELAFRGGLGRSGLSDSERISLLFELGVLYQQSRRPRQALDALQKVAGIDHFFRDVGERIAALRDELGLASTPAEQQEREGDSKDRVSYL